MNSIPLLQTQLYSVRHQLKLPEIRSSVKPVLQERGWFLSSDICILLARRMAKSPEIIADQFLNLLPDMGKGKWSRIGGYLVFSLSEKSDLVAEHHPTYLSAMRLRIFVPERDDKFSPASFMRLASLALLQGVWAMKQQIPFELVIAGKSCTESLCKGEIAKVVKHVAEYSLNQSRNTKPITESALAFISDDSAARYTLFFTPGDIDPLLFKKGAELLQFDEQVSVVIPERGWMLDIDAVPASFSYLDQIQDGVYALLLHLASDSRGNDVEWLSPEFSERKNFCWLLRSLRLRLESLAGGSLAFPGVGALSSPNVDEVDSSFILRFLPLFFERAVYFGEITALISAATAVCEYICSNLNRPEFRISLEAGDSVARTRLQSLRAQVELLYDVFFDVD